MNQTNFNNSTDCLFRMMVSLEKADSFILITDNTGALSDCLFYSKIPNAFGVKIEDYKVDVDFFKGSMDFVEEHVVGSLRVSHFITRV